MTEKDKYLWLAKKLQLTRPEAEDLYKDLGMWLQSMDDHPITVEDALLVGINEL